MIVPDNFDVAEINHIKMICCASSLIHIPFLPQLTHTIPSSASLQEGARRAESSEIPARSWREFHTRNVR